MELLLVNSVQQKSFLLQLVHFQKLIFYYTIEKGVDPDRSTLRTPWGGEGDTLTMWQPSRFAFSLAPPIQE